MFMPMVQGGHHFAPPATVAQTASSAFTSGLVASKTYSGLSIGAVADRDLVIVGVHTHGGGTSLASTTSVTIGGVSGTELADANGNDGTNACVVALYQAIVPTGTTADVVVTFNASHGNGGCVVWTAKNVNTTAHDTGSSVAANPSDTIGVEAGGIIIGYVATANAYSWTWTNLTENFDSTTGTGGSGHSGASDAFAAADATRTITATPSSATSRRAMGLVSYSKA